MKLFSAAPYKKVLGLLGFCFCFFISNAQLTAKFSARTPISGCAPLTVEFKDESTGNPTEWKWTLGNGVSSTKQEPGTTYANPGTYKVTLWVKNASGEDIEEKNQYITVYAKPVLNYTILNPEGCFPHKVTFIDNSTPGDGTIANRYWDFGDGNTKNNAAITEEHTYNTPGPYNIAIQVTNTHGCKSSKQEDLYVKIKDVAVPAFTISAPSSCQLPATYTFTNNTPDPTNNNTYKWEINGISYNSKNSTHTFTKDDDYEIKLTATTINGCSRTLTKTLKVGTPISSFDAPTVTCVGQTVAFTNTSNPAPVSSTWTFSDGGIVKDISTSKVFTVAGPYTVKLENNYGSCTSEVTRSIQVLPQPEVKFTADNTTSCKAPFTVNFTATQPDPATVASYEWNFGEGSPTVTTTTPSIPHTYTKEGFFRVTLTVTTKAGCKVTLAQPEFIKVKAPAITFNNPNEEGCIPLVYSPNISVTSVDPIDSYEWDFGNGVIVSGPTPTYTFTTPGTHTVRVTVKTKGGCATTATGTVRVGRIDKIDFSVDRKDFCAWNGARFTDNTIATPAVDRWLWDFGDGSISREQNPHHTFSEIGDQDITLTVWSNGCMATLTYPKMVRPQAPIARFTVSNSCGPDLYYRRFKDNSVGATTWSWNFGDGESANIQDPDHTYKAAGTYIVTLTVTNATCTYTTSQQVFIIDNQLNFTQSDDIICNNGTIEFAATGAAPNTIRTYSWSINGGAWFQGTEKLTQTYSTAGTYNVTVAVLDSNFCPANKNFIVNVLAPQANFEANKDIVCINNPVTFKDLSTTNDPAYPIVKWEVLYGDGKSETIIPTPDFDHIYNKSGVFKVTLKVTDSEGCTATKENPKPVEIADPKAVLSSPDKLSCTKGEVHFNNTGSTGTDLTYQWTFSSGQNSNEPNPIIKFTTEGVVDVKLVVTDKYGCKATADSLKYISINDPVAKIKMNSATTDVCPPLDAEFINESERYIRHMWNFGDGTGTDKLDPKHTYSKAGRYVAELTVWSHGGCSDKSTQEIIVDGPKGTFKYDEIDGCAAHTITFRGTSNNTVSYRWEFGNGSSETTAGNTYTYTYTELGEYTPIMVLRDNKGCEVAYEGNYVIKVFGVEADFTTDKSLLCDGGDVAFQANPISNDVIKNYTWTINNGASVTTTDKNYTYSFNGQKLYPVKMEVETEHGCKDEKTGEFKVVQSPKAKITGPDPACVPATFQFNGHLDNSDTSTVFTWEWDFANGQVAKVKDPAPVTYTTADDFVVKLKLTNSSGCTDEKQYTATAHALPKINAGTDVVICRDQSTTLQATGAQTYTWTTNASLSCTNCDKPIASPTTDETYTVTGTTMYGTLPCTASDQVIVTVQQRFTVTANKGDTLCIGEKYGLQASGADLYEWRSDNNSSIDNPTSDKVTVSPSTTTSYTVTGRDKHGCFTSSATVPVTVYPIPKVELGENREVSVGFPEELKPKELSADVNKTLWTPATGLSCTTCPNPIASPKQTTPYKIEVQNEGKCIATDFITLFMVCKGENMFLPNTFSPNGDRFNETFYPRGKGLSSVKTFRIYNRWGEVVFEGTNFQVNDKTKGWNGMHKGKAAPSDVYVYIIEILCENNEIITNKGDVTLLR